jgi:hypothetical protein
MCDLVLDNGLKIWQEMGNSPNSRKKTASEALSSSIRYPNTVDCHRKAWIVTGMEAENESQR